MKKLLTFITVLFFTFSMHAQNAGVISGYVKDKTDNRSLPGANLKLDKYNRYTISDQNGYFEFMNVPADSYTLEVSYLGYQNSQNKVVVSGGENTQVEVLLYENAYELSSVVIMGDMLRGQAKALNTQKTNSRISNVISSDQVGRFPDSNIGDALKRVPGIAMQNDQGEARNIVVRGLASELNSVTLNGNRIPSAEGDNRKVQMDLIPSDMIQTVEVSKTLTSDMDADAIGGSVDLITRAAPNGQRISATILGGYNPIREGATYSGSLVYGNRFFDNKLGFVVSGSYQNKDYGSDNIEAVWKKDDNGHVYIEEMDIRKYDVQRIRRSISTNLDWRINDNNTIAADIIYNWRDDRENRYRARFRGMEPVYDGNQVIGYEGDIRRQTKGGIDNNRNKNRRLEDQRVQSYTLRGQHLLSEKFDLDWNIGYSKACEDRPNERYIEYHQRGLEMEQHFADTRKPYISASGENFDNYRFRNLTENHNYTDEDEISAKINARVPLSVLPDQKGRLRFGLRARLKSKERDNIFYEYEPLTPFGNLSGMNTVNFTEHLTQGVNYVPGMFVSSEFLGSLNLNDRNLFTEEAVPDEYISSNYKADESVWAGYVRWDQNITNKLLLIMGLRGEYTDIKYTGNYITVDNDNYDVRQVTESNSYFNLLPSITLKYDVNKDFILRAAFTTALARPNYYSLVPYSNVNIDDAEIVAGNPALKATYAYNFDLMGEYYFQSVGILSGGVFYKRLNNFIYTYLNTSYTAQDYAADFPGNSNPIQDGESWNFTRPMNGDNVNLLGFELAVQRKLDFMPNQFLRNFAVYLNYTYTHSITKGIYSSDGEERTDIDLPGTAPHMFNASLSWENNRFSARASLNYTGSYIDEVSDNLFSDRFYDKQLFLDLNASYKFSSKLRIFAEANNLTNQALRYYQGSKERMMQLEYYKPTFNMGLKYDF